ncbi:MAG: GNA1162 family protein [Candidatus Scalindua sp.]
MKILFNNCYLPCVSLKAPIIKSILILLFLALSSCNYYQEFSQPVITTSLAPKESLIRTIAILPFKNQTDNEEIPTILRDAVFRNLSLKGYDLIKLKQIDQRLKMASYHTNEINTMGNYKLGRILEADALMYGTVTKCSKLFSVVYSRITISAELELVDTSDSKTIWKANHEELTHSGTPPMSPFAIPEKIIASSINVRNKVIVDTADTLAKKLVKGIPERDIQEVLTDYAIEIKDVGNSEVVHYKVQPNDTLFKIARKFYGQGAMWKNIKDTNDDIQSTSLKIGYDLVLPGVPILTNINDAKLYDKDNYSKAVYKIKWGDSLYNIASELYHDGRKWPVIYEENKDEIEDMNELTVGQVLIIPLSSYTNQNAPNTE